LRYLDLDIKLYSAKHLNLKKTQKRANLMTTGSASEITNLLHKARNGDKAAMDHLLPLIYGQLKSLAHHQLLNERSAHTLNTTALVHEAYVKLVGTVEMEWKSRAHFLAVASQAMRRILIDYARARLAEKRGGNEVRVTLKEEEHGLNLRSEELVALDSALERLKALDERQFQVVEYHFFGGLTYDEIAEVLSISEATVRRDWRMARAWLSQKLGGKQG
jgi:RNA polymerase sigma factor (TIGR02999 family)